MNTIRKHHLVTVFYCNGSATIKHLAFRLLPPPPSPGQQTHSPAPTRKLTVESIGPIHTYAFWKLRIFVVIQNASIASSPHYRFDAFSTVHTKTFENDRYCTLWRKLNSMRMLQTYVPAIFLVILMRFRLPTLLRDVCVFARKSIFKSMRFRWKRSAY